MVAVSLPQRYNPLDNWALSIIEQGWAMWRRTKKDTENSIRVSTTCLADFVTKAGRSAESRLRPFKFSKRGEGFARSSYYQVALRTIRAYHSQGNDPAVLEQALQEMRARVVNATDGRERTKFQHNARAVEAYRKLYGKRKFKVLPNRRLEYPVGGIIVTAQPDLWVEEEGSQVLLKIGMARHNDSYIDLVLSLLRKAALSGGLRIRARNFVYLNVSSGQEMVSSGGLTRFNRTFAAAAREIANVWPKIATEPPPPAGPREAHA